MNKRLFRILMVMLVLTVIDSAYAQGGWQSNGAGGSYGTGNNTGSGWQSNGAGGSYGTGNNTGRSCQSNGADGYNCN